MKTWRYHDDVAPLFESRAFSFPGPGCCSAAAPDPWFYCILESDSQQQIGGAATTNKILTIQEKRLNTTLYRPKPISFSQSRKKRLKTTFNKPQPTKFSQFRKKRLKKTNHKKLLGTLATSQFDLWHDKP